MRNEWFSTSQNGLRRDTGCIASPDTMASMLLKFPNSRHLYAKAMNFFIHSLLSLSSSSDSIAVATHRATLIATLDCIFFFVPSLQLISSLALFVTQTYAWITYLSFSPQCFHVCGRVFFVCAAFEHYLLKRLIMRRM